MIPYSDNNNLYLCKSDLTITGPDFQKKLEEHWPGVTLADVEFDLHTEIIEARDTGCQCCSQEARVDVYLRITRTNWENPSKPVEQPQLAEVGSAMIIRADEIHKKGLRFFALRCDANHINEVLKSGGRKILRKDLVSKGGLSEKSAFNELIERCRSAKWTVDVDNDYNLLFSSFHDRSK